MLFKDKIKRRLAVAIAAVGLSVGGVAVTALPASATTYDCIPGTCSGYYQSSDQGGQAGDEPPFGSSEITWNTNAVNIATNIQDSRGDGYGPVLWIKLCNDIGVGTCDTSTRFHLTTGSGTYAHFSHTFQSIQDTGLNGSTIDSVQLRMCNGISSSGTPLHCETNWHGPFHSY